MELKTILEMFFRIMFKVCLTVFIYLSAVMSIYLYGYNKWIGYLCVTLFVMLLYFRDYTTKDKKV